MSQWLKNLEDSFNRCFGEALPHLLTEDLLKEKLSDLYRLFIRERTRNLKAQEVLKALEVLNEEKTRRDVANRAQSPVGESGAGAVGSGGRGDGAQHENGASGGGVETREGRGVKGNAKVVSEAKKGSNEDKAGVVGKSGNRVVGNRGSLAQ